MVRMSQTLVLGGSGFIGEPLVKALREAGRNVTAPTQAEIDIETEPQKLAEIIEKYDTLIILTQPNEKGIMNVVSALALSNVQHVLYASTVLVYGSSKEPQHEDASPSPASEYARKKYAEEEILRRSTVPLTIVRLGNVYGGPKNKGIVQKAIEALYKNEPIQTSGEDQVRDFVHVDDVVAAVIALLKLPPKRSQVVNIMTGTGTTIGNMFKMLERVSGKKLIKIVGPEGEQVNTIGNIDTLQKLTGFSPRITLQEGLKKTLHVYDRSIQK
jgi:UDP-glucose 4-epimerase